MRFSTDESISESGIGLCPEPGTDTPAAEAFFPVATVSSTIVFHSPQAGHLPIHLEDSFPHALQNHTVFVFTVAIAGLFLANIVKKDSHVAAAPQNDRRNVMVFLRL
jgi:hypothetical protein